MPKAEDVRPGAWSGLRVLFDNGLYSACAGVYTPSGKYSSAATGPRIGERWNGGTDTDGYPNLGGNPLWYCLPGFLEAPALHGLLDEMARHPEHQTPEGAMNAADTARERRRRILDELSRIHTASTTIPGTFP